MPKTRRVDVLSAPNTLTSNSDAASATFGCSRNSEVVASCPSGGAPDPEEMKRERQRRLRRRLGVMIGAVSGTRSACPWCCEPVS